MPLTRADMLITVRLVNRITNIRLLENALLLSNAAVGF